MIGGLGIVPDPVEQFVVALISLPGAISSLAMSRIGEAVMMRRVMRIASSVTSRSSCALRKLNRIDGGLFGELDVTWMLPVLSEAASYCRVSGSRGSNPLSVPSA